MKSFNKLPVAILAGIVISGCPSTQSRPDCEQVTITAYLPPVVADLDYKDIRGSQNQVIVAGGFQHALSIPGRGKVTGQALTQQLQAAGNAILEAETVYFEFDHAQIPPSELGKLECSCIGLIPPS